MSPQVDLSPVDFLHSLTIQEDSGATVAGEGLLASTNPTPSGGAADREPTVEKENTQQQLLLRAFCESQAADSERLRRLSAKVNQRTHRMIIRRAPDLGSPFADSLASEVDSFLAEPERHSVMLIIAERKEDAAWCIDAAQHHLWGKWAHREQQRKGDTEIEGDEPEIVPLRVDFTSAPVADDDEEGGGGKKRGRSLVIDGLPEGLSPAATSTMVPEVAVSPGVTNVPHCSFP